MNGQRKAGYRSSIRRSEQSGTLPSCSRKRAASSHSPAPAAPAWRHSGLRLRVSLARELLPALHGYLTDFTRHHGAGVETGGMWIGEFKANSAALEFKLNGFVEAGPKAACAPQSVLFDHEYQAGMLQAIRLQHPGAGNMGCFHRHPGRLDTCSWGDRLADTAAVQASDTRALVFTIVTLATNRRDPLSLYYRNFKLDFYVLAEQTGFEYLQVRPRLVDIPVLRASPALARLSQIRGPGAFFDVHVLKRISGLNRITFRLVEQGLETDVWLEAWPRQSAESLHIQVRGDGALHAFIAGTEAPKELRGPWQQPEIGRHVWLSHLLLLMLARSGTNSSVRHGVHHSHLLEDKKRLVAEVRAVQEKFGDRAVFRYDNGQLYWEYTVEESGRRFPVEIRYPKHYPLKPPRVFSVLPLPHSPHQLVNNELCWVDQYSFRRDWNPARDTAAVAINAAHRWFACLLVFLTLGRWPEGADDQPTAYNP